MNYSTKAVQLLNEQMKEWKLAAKNFSALDNVKKRSFQFDTYQMKVQFNPARMISATAQIDKKTVKARKCILCEQNRPDVQRGVEYGNYWILVNPFPIFKQHYTITNKKHIPQLIEGNFDDMLQLAEDMEGFTIIYNGPKCGASTPEHFHFQAGDTGFMPLDNEYKTIKEKYGEILVDKYKVSVCTIDDGLRKIIAVESTQKESAVETLNSIYTIIHNQHNTDEEPRMNIHALKISNKWRVLIFVRDKHRPDEYFDETEKRILVSPGSVELGGVIITPLDKNFSNMTKENIRSIFNQVSAKEEIFDKIKSEIGEKIA